MERHWYALRTKPRAEARVATILEIRGVEIYLPQIKAGGPRRWIGLLEPLFPGYLFVHIDTAEDEWLETRSAPGVMYTLSCDGVPTAVPDSIVDVVRRRLAIAQGGLVPQLIVGDRVDIVRGPLEGLEAVFDGHLNGFDRSRVLLSILGRLSPITINTYDLRRRG